MDKNISQINSLKPFRPVWAIPLGEFDRLPTKIRDEWIGCMLRLPHVKMPLFDTPIFMITDKTTFDDFEEAVEMLVVNSGDKHHRYIERFKQDGCWLDVLTGS